MKPTQEQVIAWAREAGLHCAENYDFRGSYKAMPLLEQKELDQIFFALTLAYEAGRKDENEECGKICDAAQLFGNSDERWAAKCCADQIRRRREQ